MVLSIIYGFLPNRDCRVQMHPPPTPSVSQKPQHIINPSGGLPGELYFSSHFHFALALHVSGNHCSRSVVQMWELVGPEAVVKAPH